MTAPDDKRARLIAKIRALRAKTTANGCTEAEAMAAAELVARLMAEYDLDQTEIELGASTCIQRALDLDGYQEAVQFCANAVAEFTDTRVWRSRRAKADAFAHDLFGASDCGPARSRPVLIFFGLPQDVEIAEYLLAICDRALVGAAAQFGAGLRVGRERAAAIRSFQLGMAASMTATLRRMKAERRPPAGPANAIVVLKSALVAKQFAALGLRLGGRRRGSVQDRGALDAGRAAGAGVAFNPGVRGGSYAGAAIGGPTLRLGRS